MTTRIKVGIVGSRKYTDKRKIKDLIFEIKQKQQCVSKHKTCKNSKQIATQEQRITKANKIKKNGKDN